MLFLGSLGSSSRQATLCIFFLPWLRDAAVDKIDMLPQSFVLLLDPDDREHFDLLPAAMAENWGAAA